MGSKKSTDPGLHLVAGGLSGLLACILLQPLDLIKTRLQQSIHARISLAAAMQAPVSSLAKLTTWTTIQDISRQEGIAGFWRGTVPTILRNVPGSALYFVTLNELRTRLGRLSSGSAEPSAASKNALNLVSGAVARVSVGLSVMPITVIKTRYESNLYQYTSILDSAKSIMRTEGIPGFFRGFGATALRDAPYAGIYVVFYENFKTLLGEVTSAPTPVITMAAGIFGGFSATLATQPFDMVKTRMQLKPSEYSGLIGSFVTIAKREGARGFFSGILPRLLRKSLSSAISWTVYEEVVRLSRLSARSAST
ncbi:mitochondrial carrier domain-containing protein [Entophlyctis helioformis]|nr:mitochondrial carrier domain-containing protein [Entophlyctis helioformis]